MCKDDCEKYSESCEQYEINVRYSKNKICKHFTGNKDNINHVSNCRYHCSWYDSLELMRSDTQPLTKVNGRWRRK